MTIIKPYFDPNQGQRQPTCNSTPTPKHGGQTRPSKANEEEQESPNPEDNK